ncbi:MAG: valine--tRNA ligase [Syntrophothermus sp.]
MNNLPTVYDPKSVEDKWYKYWLDGNHFHAEVKNGGEPFSIVIPPPNVTGELHLGHALNNTVQDILIRWRRMQGYNALWMPGTDHAGIATQIKVEAELAKEGLTRHDLGREKFLDRVWAWKEKYGNQIINQLKKLGTSCDWERERFTMDAGCSAAVREVFVRLYEKGLIYQGHRIINWCPHCHTTLSDIEVEHEEREGNLWHIRYPFKDGGGEIIVTTTRPETMLGDTAVAVHPDDERYRGLVGKTVILPLMNREIPIVADAYVDPAFGTGALKVTPAHDPNDFEIGLRHNLTSITVIGDDARMTPEAGKFAGMDRYECRKAVVEELKAQGYLIKVDSHTHAVGQCYRCDTVIEPLLSKQWFVKMEPLAQPAIAAVKDGRISFIPERFAKVYLNWVENIRDWCISRQLWWGHRIPVWYCQDCGEVIVAREDPSECMKCGSHHLEQDPDVLDTWFSSALWPFSTMGWPSKTAELAYYYPTSVLVTAFDIIYFWVARMIFMGLEFMGEIPFHDVYITGLIRDAQGQKMSKSRGNGIDPLEVIDQYGADALRLALLNGASPGYDMRFYTEKVEGSRNFANKIWNASRFALMHLEDFQAPEGEVGLGWLRQLPLELPDRWILSRYNSTAHEVTSQLERYELGEASRVLYEFIWSELCDWYIEAVKPRLYGKAAPDSRRAAQSVLWYVLEHTLRLLHPFMPFITEEIWQHLPGHGESVMIAEWPEPRLEMRDSQAEAEMELLMGIVKGIRNIRAEANVLPGKKVTAILHADAEKCAILEKSRGLLESLAGLERLSIEQELPSKPEKAMTAIAGGVEVYVPLAGLIDIDKEIQRLQKELSNLENEVKRLSAKLDNPGFVQKAPAEVVEKERIKLTEYADKQAKLQERLAVLAG